MLLNLNNEARQREDRPGTAPEIQADPVESFLSRLAEFDLYPPDIRQDGKLHRFAVGESRNQAGWYVFYPGDVAAGAFGNWRESLTEKWCSVDPRTMTYEQRAERDQKIKLAQEAERKEQEKNETAAQKRANAVLNAAAPVIGQGHEYLKAKGVDAHGIYLSARGDLLVPMVDKNRCLWNVEVIKAGGGPKKGLFGGRRKGVFFTIPGQPGNNNLFICEGYSTGATIYEKTAATVICSFNAGNLPHIAQDIKELYPAHNITIAADNDQFSNGKNVGIVKAQEAARAISAGLTYPAFTLDQISTWRRLNNNQEKGPTDFNDLAALDPAAVVVQLGERDKKAPALPPLTPANTSMINWLPARPPNRDFVFNLFGKPMMPKGAVGVLSATGGTGKTFFLLALAAMAAKGGTFGPISAVCPLKVLVICGEDDQDEIGRRIWDITGGNIPPNLHAASVYGEVGPLMRLEKGVPERAAGFYWLEETLKNHPGIDLLIIDPKSRFYGLDENSNDHATEWIRCLEYLCKEYVPNILFAAHTSQGEMGRISQKMNRGATAIIDGCRWQAGLAQMDPDTADKYHIDSPRDYIAFDVPKSNYSARQQNAIYFKRTDTGALEYVELKIPQSTQDEINTFLTLLKNSHEQFTDRDLKKEKIGKSFFNSMKENHPDFKREDGFNQLINTCLGTGVIRRIWIGTGSGRKNILEVVDNG